MKLHTFACSLFLTVLAIFVSNASADVSVGFGADVTVKENAGTVLIPIKRTGDLNTFTTITYTEEWGSATLDKSELLFNHHVAPSTIVYNNDNRMGVAAFPVGVNQIYLPYSISNDQEGEDTEHVTFKILAAASSKGDLAVSTTIGKNQIKISIEDDDGGIVPVPFVGVYPGVVTEEGNATRSFVVLSEPTDRNVTLRVSTNRNTYKEANYPNGDDYQEVSGRTVLIPKGSDFAWVPIQTYQNDDPNDKDLESFQLCIDSGSVVGAKVDVPCARIFIKDVPKKQPANVSAVVFEDAIGSGWENSSWGVNINQSSSKYDGTKSLEANFTYPWSGLSLSTTGFNTTGFETLSFAIKSKDGQNDGSEVYAVLYLDDGRVNNVPIANYLPNGKLSANVWRVVHIPLTQLSATNALVKQVVFESGTVGAVLIDELSFLNHNNAGVCQ